MKKSVLTLVAIAFLAISSFAQVAINTTGAEPSTSAILDLSSDSKGLLIPRMTTNNRTTNVTAVEGLLVYDTDTDSFWFYDGTQSSWIELGAGTNSDWITSGNDMYSAVSGNVGIGTTSPTTKLQIINGNLSLRSQFTDAYIMLQSDEEEDITPAYIWSENAKGFAVGSTHGTPQLLVNAATGNVGIGTTNPNKKLSVRDGNMSIVSEGSDSYIFLGSDELGDAIGSYIWTKDNVGFAIGRTEGVPQLVVRNSNGNVGIGTTNPSTKLEVAGQIKITGGSPGDGKVLTSNSDGVSTWITPTIYASNINDLTDAKADAANLFLGDESGINNTGDFNTGTGIQALKANTSGLSNTATGFGSLQYNNTGYENTANGHMALQKNTTGNANVAFGKEALLNNTTKSNLTAFGYQALYYNGTGSTLSTQSVANTAIGSKSLYSNTLGSQNTAVGMESLKANTTGGGNTSTGAYALDSNTEGDNNTAGGAYALTSNIDGVDNTAFGYKSAYNITNGDYNAAFGSLALYAESTGTHNSAFGYASLSFNESGLQNTSVGYKSLRYNVSGSYNTAIGSQAGYNTTGSGNVFIGNMAGYNSILSNKLFIDNSNTDTPLIYGDFDTDFVKINGDLSVTETITTSDDFEYSTPKTYYLQIPASGFQKKDMAWDNDLIFFWNKYYWDTDQGPDEYLSGYIEAPVYLPDGAIVLNILVYYTMGNTLPLTEARIDVEFRNYILPDSDQNTIKEGYATTSTSGGVGSYIIDNINHTINNETTQYLIRTQIWDECDSNGDSNEPRFYGVRIEYTLDKVTH